jgi:hypothetical protein
MSTWVGVAPLIGAGSLDGFAIGALASGAFFLAITASRRGRKRRAFALSGRSGPHEEWLCEHVMAAEAFPACAERLVPGDTPDLQHQGQGSGTGVADQDGRVGPAAQAGESPARRFLAGTAGHGRGWTFPAGRGGRAARSYHSRHRRLGDPIPGSASPGRWSVGGGGVPREAAASPDDLLPAGTSRHAAFPDSALHGASRGGVHRPPELAFPDDTFGTSGRPEVRRLPRHAAPGTGLSRKLGTRMSSLMASRTATRALIGGAHG